MVGRPSRDPEVLGDHFCVQVVVGRLSWRSGSGWETFPDFLKWSVTLPKFRKWSGDPFCGQVVVGRPSRRSGSGRQTLPEVRQCRETLQRSESGRETLP